jgi:hypothetical protein
LKDMFVVFHEILQARIKGEKCPNDQTTPNNLQKQKNIQKRNSVTGKKQVFQQSHTLTTFQEKKRKREPPPGSISASAVKCLRMHVVF